MEHKEITAEIIFELKDHHDKFLYHMIYKTRGHVPSVGEDVGIYLEAYDIEAKVESSSLVFAYHSSNPIWHVWLSPILVEEQRMDEVLSGLKAIGWKIDS